MKISAIASLCIALSPLPALAADSAPVRQCKISVQGKIDVVDAEMRKGHNTNQAHKLLERRDRLRNQYKSCEKNPNAYKKNV